MQSSRRLEREVGRNLELLWLLGRLVPDHKTIADFRKDNGPAPVRVLRQPSSAAVSTWMSFAGALAMVIGFIWDSIHHIQGTESATAHALMYAGLALVVVGIPATLALLRTSRRARL